VIVLSLLKIGGFKGCLVSQRCPAMRFSSFPVRIAPVRRSRQLPVLGVATSLAAAITLR